VARQRQGNSNGNSNMFISAIAIENAVLSLTQSILVHSVCSWTRFEAKNGGNYAAVIGSNGNGNGNGNGDRNLFIPAIAIENAVLSLTQSILVRSVCSWTRFGAKNGRSHAAIIGGNSNGDRNLFISAIAIENAVLSLTQSILVRSVCSWSRFEA
jgi:hypothetical protein